MGDIQGVGDSDERPVHTVTLSAYEIGKYELTNQEYADKIGADGYAPDAATGVKKAKELVQVLAAR